MANLPKGYELPKSAGGYMKLEKGENTFRILSDIITGWEYWNAENKPVRSKEQPTELINPQKKNGEESRPKHFWAMIVWNYESKAIEILQITQKTIQGAIQGFLFDEDWGDASRYDIKVKREGDGLETEYAVTPKPHKALSEEIKKAFTDKPINLNALYAGENPFEKNNSEKGPDDVAGPTAFDLAEETTIDGEVPLNVPF